MHLASTISTGLSKNASSNGMNINALIENKILAVYDVVLGYTIKVYIKVPIVLETIAINVKFLVLTLANFELYSISQITVSINVSVTIPPSKNAPICFCSSLL